MAVAAAMVAAAMVQAQRARPVLVRRVLVMAETVPEVRATETEGRVLAMAIVAPAQVTETAGRALATAMATARAQVMRPLRLHLPPVMQRRRRPVMRRATRQRTPLTRPPTTTVSNANDNASDPDAGPPSVALTETADPTDPTNVNNAVTPELAAIEDQATTDPRGGFTPTDFPGSGLPFVTTVPPGGFRPPGGPPENVEIHAVIVSAAQSPWDAIKRAPGVATVTVVGGIVALGKTPIPGEIPGAALNRTGSD